MVIRPFVKIEMQLKLKRVCARIITVQRSLEIYVPNIL